MLGITTIAVSVAFISTVSLVLISCMSCRKFVEKRRQKKQTKEQEKVNIPDIKIDLGQPHDENGIANPVYQESEENKANEHQAEAKAEVAGNGKEEGQNEEKIEIEKEAPKEERKETPEENSKPKDIEEQVTSAVTVGIENVAFQESNEEQQEAAKDEIDEREVLADIQKEEKEPIDEESTQEITEAQVEQEIPKFEPTPLFDNDLSEEELEGYNKIFFQGEWRHPVSLGHIVEMGLIDKESADGIARERTGKKDKPQEAEGEDDENEDVPEVLKKFLRGEEPVAGIILAESGEKKSIFKSAKEGILRRGTAISLLEAQAATGNIIDPVTGRKMAVKEATQLGLLDKVYETVLLRAERAVTGYKFRASDHVLSLYEAMQKGLVVESHGLRLLEAQCATGGVIDHAVNIRVPIDVAVKRGLLDEKLREKLEDENGEETKTFFDPNTEENVTYRELMRRSVVDNDTGLRLYPLEKIAKKRMSYGSYSGRSSQSSSRTVSRSNSRENLQAAVASSS